MLEKKKVFKGVGGILAHLWNTILLQLDITPEFLNAAINRHVTKRAKNVSSGTKTHDAGNLRSALNKSSQSWKTLVRGLSILGATKINFIVEIEWPRRSPTVHNVTFDCSQYDSEEDELEEKV